jgi:two-component system, OmpR family, sensor histidine kinase KdpD
MVPLERAQTSTDRQLVEGVRTHLQLAADYARRTASLGRNMPPILAALCLVAAMTACLMGVSRLVELQNISTAYLIPVLIAATTLGIGPAIVAAVGGIAAAAFLFYPPLLDFRVHNQQQLLDLPLFLIVATVTGQLATQLRAHALRAQEREHEMRALYAFSRRLAVATDAMHIHSAIQDHLSQITGCRVVYFEPGSTGTPGQLIDGQVSQVVADAVCRLGTALDQSPATTVYDARAGTLWVVRTMAARNPAFGVVAMDTGRASLEGAAGVLERIDAVVADAAATLERLDVAKAIGEAKLRTEAETLRAALMGSVSHGLRTPLASVVGAASILVEAPAIAGEPRLAGLAGIVRDEAERLNGEIQRLLDASRISATGVRPHFICSDVADIVNAALASQRRSLSEHSVVVRLPDDLPLFNVDPVLIEQALRQFLDNAAKYSTPGSVITVEGRCSGGEIVIAVTDQAVGLSPEERGHIFERFYRGPRTRDTTTGSGLGLWIARSFVVACGGRVEAASAGVGMGSTISIVLPASKTSHGGTLEETDD